MLVFEVFVHDGQVALRRRGAAHRTEAVGDEGEALAVFKVAVHVEKTLEAHSDRRQT